MKIILFEDSVLLLAVHIWISTLGIKTTYRSERSLTNLIKYNKSDVSTLGGVINSVFPNLALFGIYPWVSLFLHL